MPVSKARSTVFSVFHVVTEDNAGVTLKDRNGGAATGGYCEFIGGSLVETSGTGTFDAVITDADGSTLFTGTTITATADIPVANLRRGYRGPFTVVITNYSAASFTISLFFKR